MRFALIILVILSSFARAETYKVAAYEWTPYIDQKLNGGGVSIELIRQALERKGHTLEVNWVPFSRAVAMFNDGKTDILPALWYSDERAETMVFSDSYAANQLVFIKAKDNPFEYEGLSSLHGKKVGIIRDYGYGQEFLADKKIDFAVASSLEGNVKKVVSGRVEFTIEDKLVAKATISPDLLSQVDFTKNALSESPLYITCHKQNAKCQSMITDFNEGITAMKADGSLTKLLESL